MNCEIREDVTIDGIFCNGRRLAGQEIDWLVNEYAKDIRFL